MSIIYDALQKVQKNITEEKAAGTNPQSPKQAPAAKPKTNHLLIYILVVCLGLTLGNFAYNFFNLKPKKITVGIPPTPFPKPLPVTPAIVTPTETPNPSIPTPESPQVLVLNGVFFEQGEGYALINNKIVQLGEEIGHAKVKEIGIEGVTLDLDGKTIKLSSPSS